jgi:hypothetical protein
MNNLVLAVKESKSLDKLRDALNELESMIRDRNAANVGEFVRLSDYVDLCELPTFSKNEPIDTCEIFSYDDKRALIQNTCVGDPWVIVERTEDFGEAGVDCQKIAKFIISKITAANSERSNSCTISEDEDNEVISAILKEAAEIFKGISTISDDEDSICELLGVDNYHAIRDAERGIY